MHLTVLVLHELIRHELAPALKIIWGKLLSSGASAECGWNSPVLYVQLYIQRL